MDYSNEHNHIISTGKNMINIKCLIVKDCLEVKILSTINLKFLDETINKVKLFINENYKDYKLEDNNLLLTYYNKFIPLKEFQEVKLKRKYSNSVIPLETNNSNNTEQMVFNNIYINDNNEHLNKKVKFSDNYLAASNTKYFQTNDILGFNLKLLNINSVDDLIKFIISDKKEVSYNNFKKNDEIKQYIFDRGVKFETYIINIIKDACIKTNLSFIKIVNDDKPLISNYNTYIEETNKAINSNVDIIYQGMIQTIDNSSDNNIKNRFRGFPDLLISTNAFLKLFYNFIDKEQCFEVKLLYNLFSNSIESELNNEIKDHYCDYIVIDIKSSNIALNVDGLTARNTDLLKLYKCQLATYGYIMENNYKKKCLTYILPHSLKLEYTKDKIKYEKTINNPYNNHFCLVKIDIHNKDQEYYNNLDIFYQSYLDCLDNINKDLNNLNKNSLHISFLLDEQINEIKELHKNCKFNEIEDIKKCKRLLNFNLDNINLDKYNIPFVKGNFIDNLIVKKWIARQTKSLSLMRGLNNNDLLALKKLNIFSFIQEKQFLDWYKLVKKKDYNLIESIIIANNQEEIVYCKDKKSKILEFDKILNKKYVCCLDFETIPSKLIGINKDMLFPDFIFEDTSSFENISPLIKDNIDNKGQRVFMIGCSIYENNNKILHHKIDLQYTLDNLENLNENIQKLFINLKTDVLNIVKSIEDTCFTIWSQFEISTMKLINNKIIDFEYDKEISKLFGIEIIDLLKIFNNSDNPIGIKGAFDYSIKSIAYGYLINKLLDENSFWEKDSNIYNGYDAMYYALWYYKNLDDNRFNNIFNNIKKYNIIDCKIMSDIINITTLYCN